MNRSFRRLMILCFAMVLDPAGFLFLARGAEVPSVDEILRMEKQLIESRRAIRSGQVVVRIDTPTYDSYPELTQMQKRYVTFFQGDNIRCDQEFTKGGERHREQIVFTKDTMIQTRPDALSATVFGPQGRPKDSSMISDPRRLGLVCWFYDTMNQFGYETWFLSPNRDRFKIDAHTDAGEPVWRVSYRDATGKSEELVEYLLAKNKGGLPLYLGARYTEGKVETLRSIRVKLQNYKNGGDGVWYPSEVVLRDTRGGKLVLEEIVTVEHAQFGQDLPEKTFTLAGLGLPKGTVVATETGKGMTWNGERLVDGQTEDVSPAVEELPTAGGPRVLWVVFSLLLAAGAALLWYRRRRSRHSGVDANA